MPAGTHAVRIRTIASLPLLDFIARWRWLVGESPAAVLESRSDVIGIRVQSAPIEPMVPAEQG